MATNLINGNFALNEPPKTLAEAVKRGQPISVVAKVTDMNAIYNQIEFSLIQAMAMLNLNLTIKESQYPFIVRELVDTFPNESIEDFQLCFKNGVTGKYGKIYNVDLSVLATWMGEYLDEKYSYIEREGIKNQAEESQIMNEAVSELIVRATESLTNEQQKEFDRKAMLRDKIIGSLSDEEVKKEGQEKPIRKPYTPPTAEEIKEKELRRQWGLENHDLHTGTKLPNWITFEEWKSKLK